MSPLFLNLPAELRIKIYKLLVASSPSDPIKIHHVKGNQSRGFAALAGVNRQLRAEYLDELQHTSISLPYSNILSLTPLLTSSSPILSTPSTLQVSLLRSPSTSTYTDLLPLLTLHHCTHLTLHHCTHLTLHHCTHLTPTFTSDSLPTSRYHASEVYWSQTLNDFFAHKDHEWVALVKDKESVLAGLMLSIECKTGISHLKLVFKEEHERGEPDWGETNGLYLKILGMKGTRKELSGRMWSWWKVTIETWGLEKRRGGGLGR